MPRLTSSQIADKMANRASAAASDYTAGVMAVQTAPGQRAAANAQGYLNGVTENVNKWQRNVGAVSLQDWQSQTANKSSRYAAGVAAAKPKITKFWDAFGPFLDSATAQTRAMPATNTEERINRAVAQMRAVAKFNK